MKTIFSLFSLLFCISCYQMRAQEIHFADTIVAYNNARIINNTRGALALGGLGIADIAAGGIGYFMAKQDEWKYFHEMNVAWGVVNTGFSALAIHRARKQVREKVNAKTAYSNYRHDKHILLLNIGLDMG